MFLGVGRPRVCRNLPHTHSGFLPFTRAAHTLATPISTILGHHTGIRVKLRVPTPFAHNTRVISSLRPPPGWTTPPGDPHKPLYPPDTKNDSEPRVSDLQKHPEEGVGSEVVWVTGEASRSSPAHPPKKPEDWNDILNRWYQQYQDFIGITDLKNAQDSVTELSEGLLAAQSERRTLQAEIEDLQSRLVDNHQRITKTEQYSHEHLELFSQARDMNERLRTVRSRFVECERTERDTFTQLSAAIRDCHERERMQAEQSKYWSIIASVVSAALASIITSINNWLRIREIKDHVSNTHQTLMQGYQQMHTDVLASLAPISTTLDQAPSSSTDQAPSTIDQASSSTPAKDSSTTQDQSIVLTPQQAPSTATDQSPVTVIPQQLPSITREELQGLFNDMTQTFSKHLSATVTNSTETIISTLTATPSTPEPLPLVLAPQEEQGKESAARVAVPVAEVSYPRVAATMMVGAALGTLVTAFFLGAIGGSRG